jgi:hypothetical protein
MIFVVIALFLACSLILSIFAFWIGRCARKLPIVDNNLPWTMSRDQARRCTADCKRTSRSPLAAATPECPDLCSSSYRSL